MKKIGYARVSTVDQSLQLQINALKRAGCQHIYRDEGASGAQTNREGLRAALNAVKRGDMLVVWRLDRLGRSLIHLVEMLDSLSKRGIEFRSLTEQIDTSSAGGRLVFHMMAALAEFERHLISERTIAGMHAARLSGGHMGRPPLLSKEERRIVAKAALEEGEHLDVLASRFNVHPRTIRRIVENAKSKMLPGATDNL